VIVIKDCRGQVGLHYASIIGTSRLAPMKGTCFLTQYCHNMCMDDRNLFLTLVGHKGQVNIFSYIDIWNVELGYIVI
jgi:hypothetical protein